MPITATQELVSKAADSLLYAGERPTVGKICEMIGDVSSDTVSRLLEKWWVCIGSRLREQQRQLGTSDSQQSEAAWLAQQWSLAIQNASVSAEKALASQRADLTAERETWLAGQKEAEKELAQRRLLLQRERETFEAAQACFEDRRLLLKMLASRLQDAERHRDALERRVKQIEDNVQHLSEALGGQPSRARHRSLRRHDFIVM
jgi:hypothetical protein